MKSFEDLQRLAAERAQGGGGVQRVDSTGKRFAFSPPNTSSGKSDQAPAFIHSRGEAAYSLANVVRALIERDPRHAPFEIAISEQLKHVGYQPSIPGAIMVPWGAETLWKTPGQEQAVERLAVEVKQAFADSIADADDVARVRKMLTTKAPMDPFDDSLGGTLVPFPMQGELIDFLRTVAVVSAAGARQVPLPPSGALSFPKGTGDPTFQWIAPNASIVESNPTTGTLLMTAKRAGALVKLPNDLIRYSIGVAEMFVRGALASRAALTEDLAYLEGTGGTTIPLGITRYPRSADNTPTGDKITVHPAGTVGANGDTLQPDDILKFLGLIEEAPDPMGATAWIMRPLMFAGLANARADAVTAADAKGPFLFPITRGALGNEVIKQLAGLPVKTSTQVSNTRAKGSATNLSYLLVGNFREAVIGRVGAVELAASDQAGFVADQMWIRAILRADFGLTRAQSFCLADTLIIPA